MRLMCCTGLALLLALPVPELAVEAGGRYRHVRERTGKNDHPDIDKFLRHLGLPLGLPWCAAYAVWSYKEAADFQGQKNPLPRYGRVSMLLEYARSREGKYEVMKPDEALARPTLPGDLPVWLYGTGPNPNGHIGLARGRDGGTMLTREGNTSSGNAGSQRDGDGVYDRRRPITGMAAVIRVEP